jgi:hypothetical protein
VFASPSSVCSPTTEKGYHHVKGDYALHQLEKTIIQLSASTTVQTPG